MTQPVRALDLNFSANPSGFTCLDQTETQGLVAYRNQCEVNTLNLKDTKESLAKCRELNGCNVAFYQEKPMILIEVATALILGIAFGVAVSK